MLPFKGRNRVTSVYGTRNGVAHNGMDIVGDDNKTVMAVSGGKVVTSTIVTNKSDKTWEWGNYVRVDLPDGTRHYYCHLASRSVKAGQTLKDGDTIGVMGNTGYSFGAHLHFEVRTKSNVAFNPDTTLGIPNAVGTYTQSTNNADNGGGGKAMAMSTAPIRMKFGKVSSGDAHKIRTELERLEIPYTEEDGYITTVPAVSYGDQVTILTLVESIGGIGYSPVTETSGVSQEQYNEAVSALSVANTKVSNGLSSARETVKALE